METLVDDRFEELVDFHYKQLMRRKGWRIRTENNKAEFEDFMKFIRRWKRRHPGVERVPECEVGRYRAMKAQVRAQRIARNIKHFEKVM